MKKIKTGRPKTRLIDDSIRPAAERGLPFGEIRYSTVYNKDQLNEVKALAKRLAENSKLKKVGSVPPVQFKNLIYEALSGLLMKYQKKDNKPKRLSKKESEDKLRLSRPAW